MRSNSEDVRDGGQKSIRLTVQAPNRRLLHRWRQPLSQQKSNSRTEKLPKRRRVVYLLGSGFSAPLGLPVMSNWTAKAQAIVYKTVEGNDKETERPYYRSGYKPEELERAREEYLRDFLGIYKEVIDTIEQLAIGKSYYNTDFLNMEDLFSTVWMRAALNISKAAQGIKDRYIEYIVRMIEYYTPRLESIEKAERLPSNWPYHLFGQGEDWNLYGLFFAALFNLVFKVEDVSGGIITSEQVRLKYNEDALADYSIVTLNYDRIPNKPIEYIRKTFKEAIASWVPTDPSRITINYVTKPSLKMRKSLLNKKRKNLLNKKRQRSPYSYVRLAKIHGDVACPKTIIPPIYSKAVDDNTDPHITDAWQLAAEALKEATDLRIIGYSLPITDTYIKYLLRAVITSGNLQNIHVICRDTYGEVSARYDDFVRCKNYQFVDGDVREYLRYHMRMYDAEDISKTLIGGEYIFRLDKLEKAHNKYMEEHTEKVKVRKVPEI